MLGELERFMTFMRSAFSRTATHQWFVVAFIGLTMRGDTLGGVTSIIRALMLDGKYFNHIRRFFYSSAWSVETLVTAWWKWLTRKKISFRVNGRMVLVADHTKVPKDGRKMPSVTTLHQDSETGSKPSFFRGHHWGCLSVVEKLKDKFASIPLWANIQEGLSSQTDFDEMRYLPKTTQVVEMTRRATMALSTNAYLVLDAFFAVGPVFLAAAEHSKQGNRIDILTRAKKNVVAYLKPPPRKKGQRGRSRKYGKKLKLHKLFDSKAKRYQFTKAKACVYGKVETVRYLALNLVWKPFKGELRFILSESSRGRIVLITSDLDLDPAKAIELYCRRVTIETMFSTLKNTLGGMSYKFWSKYLEPSSRRPKKRRDANGQVKEACSTKPKKTQMTLEAIEKFVNLQLLIVGFLQLIGRDFCSEIKKKSRCYLRTKSKAVPSEFVTRSALINILRSFLYGFGDSWITHLIRKCQKSLYNKAYYDNAA